MKIVLIGTAFPFRGGLASYNERMAAQFMDEGHEVSIETFSLQYPGFLFPGKTQLSDSPKPDHLTINISVNSINPFNWIKVGRRIRKSSPDLVIFKYWIPFMGPCFGTISRLIRKNKITKVISVLDNIIPHEKRIGDNLMTKYFVSAVDGFLSMSKSVNDDLSFFNTSKPRTLSPHPLFDNFGEASNKNTAKEKLGLDTDTDYMLFFGFIRDYKGLDLILKAISSPWFKDSNVKLLVAGEFYSNEKKYLDLIKEFDINDRVVLRTTFISNEEVGLYFSSSDIIVQPYKTATQSGVTQIAYHFNKPMLVTDVGGLAEICPHEKVGYVVDVDCNKIADALIDFYDNKRHDEFVANVKEEKKKYAWSTLTGNILKVYNQC